MTKMAGTRSGGPRTIAGKTRSSLNALRHGLATRLPRQTAPPDAVDRLAQAICGGKDDAELLAAARAIAETSFVLHAIRQQKIIAIERLKDATAIALRKGDNSFILAKARFLEAWIAYREIQKLVPQVMKKYEVKIPHTDLDGDIVPVEIKALVEEPTDEEQERALEFARCEIQRQQRNEKSAARREAILRAALDEFSARGFAATRVEDVARRAGVAKGTIYLHFADKEALFQELVRTMLGPLVASLDQLRATDLPIRTVLERFADLFVIGIYGTRRRDVVHLVISEGARFPTLAEFYYHEVVERGMAAMSALLERAIARGEIPHTALARFPQLVAAPGLIAIIWRGLFDRFAHLDAAGMMRAHIDILLGPRSSS